MLKDDIQYSSLLKKIINEGQWVDNPRTKTKCLTIPHVSLTYDENIPLITTRKTFWKNAIMEIVCYIRGYYKLSDFKKLGVNTWDANANAWQDKAMELFNEPAVGYIYGASSEKVGVSFLDVINKLKKEPYDRGHIWNFWNPSLFKEGCLRPCMFNHQFNVIGDTLYLTSTQR